MQQRLLDIGSWLQVNGEAIYGTRSWSAGKVNSSGAGASPGGPFEYIRFTRKGPDLFAHFLEWPDEETRIVGLNPSGDLTVELLGFQGPVEWGWADGILTLDPPILSPSQIPSPFAYVFKLGGALAHPGEEGS